MTAGAAVSGLRRRAGGEAEAPFAHSGAALEDDPILGGRQSDPLLQSSPLRALRERKRQSRQTKAPSESPMPEVWRAPDAPAADGGAAAVLPLAAEALPSPNPAEMPIECDEVCVCPLDLVP
jgi:hypothetical protein